MNKADFVSYCRQHISPEESGFLYPSAEDIERWSKHGYFRYAPQYHKDDIHLVFAILRNEKELQRDETKRETPEAGERPGTKTEPGLDKEPITEYESEKWQQRVTGRVASSEFQEMVALARKTLTPPKTDTLRNRLSCSCFRPASPSGATTAGRWRPSRGNSWL